MKNLITLLLLFVTTLTMAQTYEIQGLKINDIRYTLGDNMGSNLAIQGNFGVANTVGVILKVTSLGTATGTMGTQIAVFTTAQNTVPANTPTNTVSSTGPLAVGQSYVFTLPGSYDFVGVNKNQYLFFVNTIVDFETGAVKTQVPNQETFKIRAVEKPLPVTLTSFTAVRTASIAQLTWATAQEVNSSHYDVQASTNGTSFTTLATVAGAGNSTTPRSYAFRDTRSLTGTVYYRLRQVDIDGTATYSPVVVVGSNTAMRTYNVGSFEFSIPESATPEAVTILDMNGRVLSQQRPDAPLVLPAEGTMFIMALTTKEGKRYTKKIL